MALITQDKPVIELVKAIGLNPSQIHNLTIVIENDGVVTCHVSYLPTAEQFEAAAKVAIDSKLRPVIVEVPVAIDAMVTKYKRIDPDPPIVCNLVPKRPRRGGLWQTLTGLVKRPKAAS